MPAIDLVLPFFGYKSHISIDRKFRLIRTWKATNAADSDGTRLREGLQNKTKTTSRVSADATYRSKAIEDFMEKQDFVSNIHREKSPLKEIRR